MLKFVITAGAISGNKGTESMVAAVCRQLIKKYPDCSICLLSYHPGTDKPLAHRYGIKILSGTPLSLLFSTLPLSMLVKVLDHIGLAFGPVERNPVIRAIRDADMVFDVGGITFSDGREIYLPFNIITLLPALLMARPVVKLSQALGPFAHKLTRFAAVWFLPRMDRIYARGRCSLSHLEAIGLTNAAASADLAFTLETVSIAPRKKRPIVDDNKKTVGVAPSSVVFKYCKKCGIDYIDIMARFIAALKHEFDLTVILIPHSIKRGTRALKNNDLPVIRAIENRMPPATPLHIVDDDLGIDEMRALIAGCDFFVASRFHSMISALSGKVPLIVVGWGHKYKEVLDQFGISGLMIDYRTLDVETILDRFRRIFLKEKEIRLQIDRMSPEIVKSSFRQFHETFNAIDHRG